MWRLSGNTCVVHAISYFKELSTSTVAVTGSAPPACHLSKYITHPYPHAHARTHISAVPVRVGDCKVITAHTDRNKDHKNATRHKTHQERAVWERSTTQAPTEHIVSRCFTQEKEVESRVFVQ